MSERGGSGQAEGDGVKVMVVLQTRSLVNEIEIEGAQRISAKKLRKQIALKINGPLTEEELQKARAAFGNGSLPSFRVAEFRRSVLYSATRQLQTTNQLMEVERARAQSARELEKLDDQRRIRLLTELQDATVKLTDERAKLRIVEQKLQLAGLRPPRISDDGSSKVDITLFRSGKERHSADVDTELQPADVIEVSLRPEAVDIAAQ